MHAIRRLNIANVKFPYRGQLFIWTIKLDSITNVNYEYHNSSIQQQNNWYHRDHKIFIWKRQTFWIARILPFLGLSAADDVLVLDKISIFPWISLALTTVSRNTVKPKRMAGHASPCSKIKFKKDKLIKMYPSSAYSLKSFVNFFHKCSDDPKV